MTYYEELAVAQDASLDEIHQAYRALARLLHPDRQSDPALKSAAERQMLRLNSILETLTDPQKRHKYDESLYKNPAPHARFLPSRPVCNHLLQRHGPWMAACCMLFAAGVWYLRSNESGEPYVAASPLPDPQRSTEAEQTTPRARTPLTRQDRSPSKTQLRNRSQDGPAKSPSSQKFIPSLDSAPSQPVSQSERPEVVASLPHELTEAVERSLIQPVGPPPEVPTGTPRTPDQPRALVLTGHWFYSPRIHEPETPGMYPPEFIELFISEAQGVLSGKYWARYRISDQPVSPEVQFRVHGPLSNGVTTSLDWVADDGAKGQLQLVLRSPNSMEVTWWTSVFGRHTALTSGTARLVRQQTR